MEVLTAPGTRCRLYFRFYGPQPLLFAKTWKLSDLAQVQ
jgi:hypothetical protein